MLSSRPISFNADIDVPQSTLNAKTPARKALKGRSALQENAIHSGAKTVFSKKNILHTPFRPGTAHGKKPLVSISLARPLVDKTPFPNRVAAANFGGAGPAGKTPGMKLSKLALLVSQPQQESLSPDVAPLLRPSSARKSLRGRLSGSNFKTPLTKGNYWDVSPGDMEGIGGVAEEVKEEAEVAVDEEDDEIEYMPPTAVELPYEPLFEIPDYKAMGRALFELGHGGFMDDTADVYYAMDIEQQIDLKQLLADTGFKPDWFDDGLQLPELEDDSPFACKPTPASAPAPQSQAQPRPPASKSASSIPLARASSSTRTSAALARPATTTPPTQSRPASASSSRVPQPTIVPAPGQTRTSALRAAKAAAAAAGLSAPKANLVAGRRLVASASSTTVAAGTKTKTKTQAQAQAPAHAHAQVQAHAQGQTRAIVRSATSVAISAKAKGMGTGTGASAGTGTGASATAGVRARSATVNGNGNVLGRAKAPGGPSPAASGGKGTGARGGKADDGDRDRDGDEDELATALQKAIGDARGVGGEDDFVFDV
ncbi:hypothetical protein LXA43DRAFT_1098270 [Ganoderma leucocontextum]|nr:hypothetical protein LXA43DRAFT_1098270 [Ganoderma leucocontextum]